MSSSHIIFENSRTSKGYFQSILLNSLCLAWVIFAWKLQVFKQTSSSLIRATRAFQINRVDFSCNELSIFKASMATKSSTELGRRFSSLLDSKDHLFSFVLSRHGTLLAVSTNVFVFPPNFNKFLILDVPSFFDYFREMPMSSYPSYLRHMCVSLDKCLVVF